MICVILAGGRGSRLRPLTDETPKPALPIANVPLIERTLSRIKDVFDEVIVTIGYRGERVISAAEPAQQRVSYVAESTPLGSLGGVKRALGGYNGNFAVLSGDGLSDINIREVIRFHTERDADATIVTTPSDTPHLYGVPKTHGELITAFAEKPMNAPRGSRVNTGVYVVNTRVLDLVPNKVCDFSRDLFPLLVERNKLYEFRHTGYWRDIGNAESYYNANFEFIGNGDVHPSARVLGRVLHSVVGENCYVSRTAEISDCVILPGASVTGKHSCEIIGKNFIVPVYRPAPAPSILSAAPSKAV